MKMINDNLALWLSSASTMLTELASDRGFSRLVLDLEHGVFDQATLDRYFPFCRALGFKVFAKVLGPECVPIQQALDFGASGVIIPHIEDLEQARRVTAYAKYPPLGTRSFAAGRIVRYGRTPDGFFENENANIRCYPMIESAAAYDDVAKILALPTVDGIFVGPTDLALSRGRLDYRFTKEDQHDIERIAAAAREAGKPWVMPAWSAGERRFSIERGVDWMVVTNEQSIAANGLDACLDALSVEGVES